MSTPPPMSQEQFDAMFRIAMEHYRQSLRDNDSGLWSQEARAFALKRGLFTGSSRTPDGQPNMMWQDFLTREQAAQLLYRFAQGES